MVAQENFIYGFLAKRLSEIRLKVGVPVVFNRLRILSVDYCYLIKHLCHLGVDQSNLPPDRSSVLTLKGGFEYKIQLFFFLNSL